MVEKKTGKYARIKSPTQPWPLGDKPVWPAKPRPSDLIRSPLNEVLVAQRQSLHRRALYTDGMIRDLSYCWKVESINNSCTGTSSAFASFSKLSIERFLASRST